ncbi:GNAT family N-acetyltransferase [Timonella sp. A28]|uniref:GNAT family N-acetyltransferase n=1 Tax=Timonella sp. A28 TaxID=3442640 RepID=UPI003EB993D1
MYDERFLSQATYEAWFVPFHSGRVLYDDGSVKIVENTKMRAQDKAMVMMLEDGSTLCALNAGLGMTLPAKNAAQLTREDLLRMVGKLPGKMYDADYIFSYTPASLESLVAGEDPASIRMLGPDDDELFQTFQAQASEDDKEEAYVELDHWSVVGLFEDDELVAVSSAYPWGSTSMADIGVLTLEKARGRGYGRVVVQAMARNIVARGYEPLYRCDMTNSASSATARSAGFTEIGQWVIVSDSE